MFIQLIAPHENSLGSEVWFRSLDGGHISVSCLAGSWETNIRFEHENPGIVTLNGDHRVALETATLPEIRSWLKEHGEKYPSTFLTLVRQLAAARMKTRHENHP